MNIVSNVFPKTKYYAKDQSGNMRFWQIEASIAIENNKEIGYIEIFHGVVGGEEIGSYEKIDEGLANRSLKEQVFLRANSRIHNKLKVGYLPNFDEAKNSTRRKNLLGLKRCMTAKKYKNVYKKIVWSEGVYIQRKYNGNRCMINIDEEITPYSRGGEVIPSIDFITDRMRECGVPVGVTFDGELYKHGVPLQTITSWIKKKQPESKTLQYIIYDVMFDSCYEKRYEFLKELNIWNESIILAPTKIIYSPEEAITERDFYISQKYEGAMLRIKNTSYQDGKQSNSLIKMKETLDGEFLIVGVTRSSHGWGILECVTKDGKKFNASAPGNIDEKRRVLENKNEVIGNFVNIEFPEWTVDGKPSQAVAKYIRNRVE